MNNLNVSLEELQKLNEEVRAFNELVGAPKSKYLKHIYIRRADIKYSKVKFNNISSRRVKKYPKKLKTSFKIAIVNTSFNYI